MSLFYKHPSEDLERSEKISRKYGVEMNENIEVSIALELTMFMKLKKKQFSFQIIMLDENEFLVRERSERGTEKLVIRSNCK